MDISKSLDDRIKNLPYVQIYGGLCKIHQVKDKDGNSFKIPISNETSPEECLEKERYKIMLPNEDYNSSFFIIQKGKSNHKTSKFAARKTAFGTNRPQQISKNYQLIGWINLSRFGLKDNSIYENIKSSIYYNVFMPKINNQDKKFLIKSKFITAINEPPTFIKPLEKALTTNWNMYPFLWITIDFQMSYHTNCIEEIEIGDPIDCINFSNLINPNNASIL